MAKKPIFMDKAEVKARVRDGIAVRIKDGRMRDPRAPVARPDRRGAHFTKAQRRRFIQLCELAIYSLANQQYSDWYDALVELTRLMAEANFSRAVAQHTCKEIEHMAVQASGDKRLYAEAAKWIHFDRNRSQTRVTSVHGQSPGDAKNEAANDPIETSFREGQARRSDEREPGDGEARRPKDSIH